MVSWLLAEPAYFALDGLCLAIGHTAALLGLMAMLVACEQPRGTPASERFWQKPLWLPQAMQMFILRTPQGQSPHLAPITSPRVSWLKLY
jgi:hypothetical protein